MTTKLIATASYPYAGRSLSTGDAFEASERDAQTLKLIGRAVDAPSEGPPVHAIQTRDLTPKDPPSGTHPEPTPKRRYRRRDLQAEE